MPVGGGAAEPTAPGAVVFEHVGPVDLAGGGEAAALATRGEALQGGPALHHLADRRVAGASEGAGAACRDKGADAPIGKGIKGEVLALRAGGGRSGYRGRDGVEVGAHWQAAGAGDGWLPASAGMTGYGWRRFSMRWI